METTIIQEHPEYQAKMSILQQYRDLYAGGDEFKHNASSYLIRRQKEPHDVYSERLNRVFYENYVGSIIDWYGATLFRREPRIVAHGNSNSGRDFLSRLADDSDRRGTNLSEFFRRQVIQALTYGSSYILVDFPRASGPALSRAEEDRLGLSRAYLQSFTPLDLINWSHDDQGNLSWAVLRTSRLHKERLEDEEWIAETRWTYFDRLNYRVYRQVDDRGRPGPVELIAEGRHALAGAERVPIFELQVTEGLWMMRKAAQLQLEHFNKSNALSWALTMGLFAMPVVYSDREFRQIIGESYYIQLGPEDKFGWTEPEGHVYRLAAENLTRLQNEIYRICYLLSQAGAEPAKAQPQSGLSKLRDYAITQEVLRTLGDGVKDVIKNVLRAVLAARGDDLLVDVTGLDDFDIGDLSSDLDDAERLVKLGIGSATFLEQMEKKLTLKYLCDIRSDQKDAISREIEAKFRGEGR